MIIITITDNNNNIITYNNDLMIIMIQITLYDIQKIINLIVDLM
jgi:hypothetical protein